MLPVGLGGDASVEAEGAESGTPGRTFLEEEPLLPPAELGGAGEEAVAGEPAGGGTFLEQEAPLPPSELGGAEAEEKAVGSAGAGTFLEQDSPLPPDLGEVAAAGDPGADDLPIAGREPAVQPPEPAATDDEAGMVATGVASEPKAAGMGGAAESPAADLPPDDLDTAEEGETDRLDRPAAFALPSSSSPDIPSPPPEPIDPDISGAAPLPSDPADGPAAPAAGEPATPAGSDGATDESATDKLDRPAELVVPPPGPAAVPAAAGAPARGPFELEVVQLDGGIERVALPPGEHVVGRGKSASLPLDNPTLSRRHARIVVLKGRVRVTDLGSTNHTWVAGEQVEPGTEVEAVQGAELRFGALVARLTRQRHEERMRHSSSGSPGRGSCSCTGIVLM
jgi:hypothetical protein